MAVLKSLCLAFSMYSRIPMPPVAWEEKNMRYVLCFFPLVGLVVGGGMYGLWRLRSWLGVFIPFPVFVLTGTVLPILISGGIHMDGFMDTMDAFCSCHGRERKLEILKDPHAGAFACISLACVMTLYGAALYLLLEERQVLFLGLGYVLSRTLSAFALLTIKNARGSGTASTFSAGASKKIALPVLSLWLFLAAEMAFFLYGVYGILCVALSLSVFFYYQWMAYRHFGGLTGDLAGWFVVVYELVFVWLSGIMGYVWNL